MKPNCVKKRKIAENFFTLAYCLLPCYNDNFQRQPTYTIWLNNAILNCPVISELLLA